MLIIQFIIVVVSVAATAFIINKIEEDKFSRRISFKETMDLLELPVITMWYKNIKLHFLLDTGSNNCILTKEVADTLNLSNVGESEIYGLEGNTQSVYCAILDLTYHDHLFKDNYFQIVDMSQAFARLKAESGLTIHGILGSRFMQTHKYVLDFDKLIASYKKK